jgi:hypothetical protein
MRRSTRSAGLAAAVLLAVAGVGSSGAAMAVSAQTTMPVVIHYYSVSTGQNMYTQDGTLVTDPNATPVAGDYIVSTDNDYVGTQANHSMDVAATDHLYCLVVQAPGSVVCSGQIAVGDSMILADNSMQDFSANSTTQTFQVTGGTGDYQGATGTVVTTQIGNTNNSEFLITLSK